MSAWYAALDTCELHIGRSILAAHQNTCQHNVHCIVKHACAIEHDYMGRHNHDTSCSSKHLSTQHCTQLPSMHARSNMSAHPSWSRWPLPKNQYRNVLVSTIHADELKCHCNTCKCCDMHRGMHAHATWPHADMHATVTASAMSKLMCMILTCDDMRSTCTGTGTSLASNASGQRGSQRAAIDSWETPSWEILGSAMCAMTLICCTIYPLKLCKLCSSLRRVKTSIGNWTVVVQYE